MSAYLQSRRFDLSWILLPPFASVVGALVLYAMGFRDLSLGLWFAFVLGIDVSHVYATLYRTYWNKTVFQSQKTLLTTIPIICFTVGALLYATHPLAFWRVLAYLAVFHFVRQQYGFFVIYAVKNNETVGKVDKAALYLSMIYPLIYWHVSPERDFHWFIDGDFWSTSFIPLANVALAALIASWVLYGRQEWRSYRQGTFNTPKNLVILGTLLSWNVGIVLFNSDVVFTVTNVVSHGVPYLALIWLYGRSLPPKTSPPRWLFQGFGTLVYFGVLLGLAYFEEGMWDGLVWKERTALFSWAKDFPTLDPRSTLCWIVPLLTLPQATHYVIDGFIWKVRGSDQENRFLNQKETVMT